MIAGCGRLGNLLAEQLLTQGHRVWGIRRNIGRLASGVQGISWNMGSEPAPDLPAVDWLVYAASPNQRTPDAYQQAYLEGPAAVYSALPNRPAGGIFVSSTAVYAQDHGELVDEGSKAQPEQFNGELLLKAESAFADQLKHAIVVRCSGLYGPAPGRLMSKLRAGKLDMPVDPPVYGNRIHRRDAARAITWIMRQNRPQPLYLLSDSSPTLRHEVYQWLARRLDRSGVVAFEQITPGEPRGKRIQPSQLLQGGFRFLYPDYRAGFEAIISENTHD